MKQLSLVTSFSFFSLHNKLRKKIRVRDNISVLFQWKIGKVICVGAKSCEVKCKVLLAVEHGEWNSALWERWAEGQWAMEILLWLQKIEFKCHFICRYYISFSFLFYFRHCCLICFSSLSFISYFLCHRFFCSNCCLSPPCFPDWSVLEINAVLGIHDACSK